MRVAGKGTISYQLMSINLYSVTLAKPQFTFIFYICKNTALLLLGCRVSAFLFYFVSDILRIFIKENIFLSPKLKIKSKTCYILALYNLNIFGDRKNYLVIQLSWMQQLWHIILLFCYCYYHHHCFLSAGCISDNTTKKDWLVFHRKTT